MVGQSGGPTAVINASLAGIYRKGKERGCKVFGTLNGIEGLLEDTVKPLEFSDRDVELLIKTPSAALGSCRFKLLDSSEEKFQSLKQAFKKYEIDAFFYIGGNDSMETVEKLSRHLADTGIKFIGVPKTIDNDLDVTDHCPGFGSAAKYLCTTMQELILDCNAYALHSVTIVEIMGRDTGWLTASTCILENPPDLIYTPEMDFSVENFLEDIKYLGKRNIVIAMSEGINLGYGYRDRSYKDAFGHLQNAGVGKYLAEITNKELGCKTRAVELNIVQRCCAHLQSTFDVREAVQVGEYAVDAALKGETGIMTAIKRLSDFPYSSEYFTVPVNQVAGKVKYVPKKWLTSNSILPEAKYYFSPLVGSLPEYFTLK
jgi:6-phosphofructokinase 1